MRMNLKHPKLRMLRSGGNRFYVALCVSGVSDFIIPFLNYTILYQYLFAGLFYFLFSFFLTIFVYALFIEL